MDTLTADALAEALQEPKKGLLTNSTDICRGSLRLLRRVESR